MASQRTTVVPKPCPTLKNLRRGVKMTLEFCRDSQSGPSDAGGIATSPPHRFML
jgi:hypothetical protein